MILPNIELPDALTLRSCEPCDQEFIKSLYRAGRQDLQLAGLLPEQLEILLDQQQAAQEAGYHDSFPDADYLIIEQSSQPIGRLIIESGSDSVRVVDLMFLPQAQRCGYGTAILRALQSFASSISAPLLLSVSHANTVAQQLYLKLGFVMVRTTPLVEEMVWNPCGPQQDCLMSSRDQGI